MSKTWSIVAWVLSWLFCICLMPFIVILISLVRYFLEYREAVEMVHYALTHRQYLNKQIKDLKAYNSQNKNHKKL